MSGGQKIDLCQKLLGEIQYSRKEQEAYTARDQGNVRGLQMVRQRWVS